MMRWSCIAPTKDVVNRYHVDWLLPFPHENQHDLQQSATVDDRIDWSVDVSVEANTDSAIYSSAAFYAGNPIKPVAYIRVSNYSKRNLQVGVYRVSYRLAFMSIDFTCSVLVETRHYTQLHQLYPRSGTYSTYSYRFPRRSFSQHGMYCTTLQRDPTFFDCKTGVCMTARCDAYCSANDMTWM